MYCLHCKNYYLVNYKIKHLNSPALKSQHRNFNWNFFSLYTFSENQEFCDESSQSKYIRKRVFDIYDHDEQICLQCKIQTFAF